MSSSDESESSSSSSGSQDSGSSSSNSGDSSNSPPSGSDSSSSSGSSSSSSGSDSSSSNSPPSPSSSDSQSNSPPSDGSSSSSGSQDSGSSSSSSSDSGDSQSNSTPPPPNDSDGSSDDNSGTSSSPPSQGSDNSSQNSPPTSSSSSSPPPPTSSVPSPPSDSSPSPPQAISPPSSDGSKQSPSSDNSPSSSGNSNERTRSSSDNMDKSPSKHSSSSSATDDVLKTARANSGNGLAIALIVVVIVIMILTICCLARKKRRRNLEALDYHPPTSISIRSDGNYYGPAQTQGPNSGSYTQPSQYGMQGGSNRYGGHSGQFEPSGGGKSWFSYEELAHVTNGFSRENLIGEGGFGCVYKGVLNDGRKVAIKQLKAGSGQGEREFQAEVEIISRVHHRHLVSLCGYCMSQDHRLLVYEYLPNNTLEYHLHNKNLPPMEWANRLKIAIGSAKGLAYLHEDCHPKIIHRDIKSANILLEESFEPQVADFGLAKLSNDTHTHVSTRIMGTFGYLAPEYASSGKLTDKSDVFSFGVVLLEIITGRKPVDSTQAYGDECLVEWARPLLVQALETGNCDELVDPRLEGNYNKYEMFNMIEAAAACVRHSAPKRPRMVQVVRVLDSQDEMGPDLSNGVKYGQSQAFTPSEQGAVDMQRFRRMAFGNDTDSYGYDSGDYDRRSTAYSGEYRREHRPPPPPPGMYHFSGGRNHL